MSPLTPTPVTMTTIDSRTSPTLTDGKNTTCPSVTVRTNSAQPGTSASTTSTSHGSRVANETKTSKRQSPIQANGKDDSNPKGPTNGMTAIHKVAPGINRIATKPSAQHSMPTNTVWSILDTQLQLWNQSRLHWDCYRKHGPKRATTKRLDNLLSFVSSPTVLAEAARRVVKRSRNKAVGIDKMTVQQFVQNKDAILIDLHKRLTNGTYRPQPVRRVEILKRNGKKRPLGIPCLTDKIVQEAIRKALEPIYESEFHQSSFGFRPNRGMQHAVHQCREHVRQGYHTIIEGDIKACFDKIKHVAILNMVRVKIKDEMFINLIERFLNGDVSINGITHSTTEGVPQGSIIGPILANIVLNRLDWHLERMARIGKYGDTRFVRYADDFCIFLKDSTADNAVLLKDDIAQFLHSTTGLELSPEKTLITDAASGFNFLGFHLSQETNENANGVRVEITADKLQAFKDKLDEIIDGMDMPDQLDNGIGRINSIVRGWGQYARLADNFPVIAGELDAYIACRFIHHICHVKGMTREQCRNGYYRKGTRRIGYILIDDYRLIRLSDLDVIRDVRPPKPYRPK